MSNIKQYGRVFALCCLLITLGCAGNKNGNGDKNGGGAPGSPPETPQNFTAMASDGQVTLSWNTEPDVIYELYHSTETGFTLENGMKISPVTSPYVHMGLTNETTYYYLLRANNSAGASEPTAEVSATPGAPPETPRGFMAMASDGQITLSWTAKEGLTYELYHSTTSGFELENGMKIDPPSSPYTHMDLTNDVTYYYLLRAVNSFGASVPTAEVSAAPIPSARPAVPQNFEAMASDGQITLSWTEKEGLRYALAYSRTAGTIISEISPVTSPYIHMGLTNDVTYYYRLRAVNSFGSSLSTTEISAAPIPSARPETPENFMATAFDRQVTLEWDSQEVLTYDLFHSITPGIDVNDMNVMQISGVTSPYPHTGLSDNTTYYYRLRAVNSFGASVPTAEISATPMPPPQPAAPQNFMAAASSGQVRLTWRSQPSETYDLFHSTSEGFILENGTKVSSVTPPYIHRNLMDSTRYYYRLRAENRLGTGPPTAEISAITPTPLSAAEISAGDKHSCAVVNDRALCWGRGRFGQLGNGGTSDTSAPEQVYGLTAGVTQISAGERHTCALVESGAKCWGSDEDGRLGNGDASHANTPQQVDGLTTGVTQISAGNLHTCALVEGGRALCWGNGKNGRLGNGSNSYASTPQEVRGLTAGVTQISAGMAHTCALVEGRAWCWGRNDSGQLGNGRTSYFEASHSTPREVRGLTTGVTQISAGGLHTCAVVDGAAMCWGWNDSGRLGDGGNSNVSTVSTPQQVGGLTTGVTQISAGGSHTCAVVEGRAVCWGRGRFGQLGNGGTSGASTPQQVPGLTAGVTQISAGDEHTCALVDGVAKCWGKGEQGRLGTNTAENKRVSISVVDPATIPPKTPRNFWAAASEEQVTLTWAQQGGVTYDLFFSTRAGFGLESGTRISPVTSPHEHTGVRQEAC